MKIKKYIKNRINEIDKKLVNLIDYDEIMRLRQQRTAYIIYLEILEYEEKTKEK